jgi:hypothetical protein
VTARRGLAAAVLLSGLLAVTACGSGGSATTATTPAPPATAATTGIDLLTVAGPTCPAQRAGQSCTRPISARVEILAHGLAVTAVQTGADGTAHVPLPPGVYTIKGVAGGSGFPRPPAPDSVAVAAGHFVTVRLDYDTGIR